jgi:UDP-2-acetamido-3-amino-2,3-dideoxy-glucuronate N-acetyltransferase
LKQPDASGVYTCPESGLRYQEVHPGRLSCLDIDEDAMLPDAMRVGAVSYDDIVHGGSHASSARPDRKA